MPVDVHFYKRAYQDMGKMMNHSVATHFARYGRKEGRICCFQCFHQQCPEYDDALMISRHPELSDAFLERRIAHYYAHRHEESPHFVGLRAIQHIVILYVEAPTDRYDPQTITNFANKIRNTHCIVVAPESSVDELRIQLHQSPCHVLDDTALVRYLMNLELDSVSITAICLSGDEHVDAHRMSSATFCSKLMRESSCPFKCIQLKSHVSETMQPLSTIVKNVSMASFQDMTEHLLTHLYHMYHTTHPHTLHLTIDPATPIMWQLNVKLNAIYFPQFHQIPENDRFWGQGFTEWTLLKPAQDKIPIGNSIFKIQKPHSDIGYYDLSDVNVLKRQVQIAQSYGLHAFIVYHYWFHGESTPNVMHKPLEFFKNHPEIDFPFAISWANESWSRRWDGSNKDVLLKQEPGNEEGWTRHIHYLMEFFKLPNYLRDEEGNCLFYIYQTVELHGKFHQMLATWKRVLDAHGLRIRVIHTLTGHSMKNNDELVRQFDDLFVFQPMYQVLRLPSSVKTENHLQYDGPVTADNFDYDFYQKHHPDLRRFSRPQLFEHYERYGKREGRVFNVFPNAHMDHVQYVRYHFKDVRESYMRESFPSNKSVQFGVHMDWNNWVRRKNIAFMVVDGCTPDLFREYVEDVCIKAIVHHGFDMKKHKYVIVNAWNEWNEQAILEPSNVHGYTYLEALKKGLH